MKRLQITFYIILSLLFMGQSVLAQKDDWPNLAKYRDSNKKIDLPAKNENRVVFMGNSITEFWGKLDPDFFKSNSYINRGISGQTSPQMLIRFRPDVVNLKPKVVVILAGTNDIAGNTGYSTLEMILDNIKSMVEIAKANHIKVVLCSVLPAIDFFWHKGLKPAKRIIMLNKLIKAYSNKNKIVYVDYYTPMADKQHGLKKEYSNDGVHPNETGYKIMEPLVEERIAKALKQ